MQKKYKILVADDDPAIVDSIEYILDDEGYEVETTIDGETVGKMFEHKPDLLLLDIWMSGQDGSDICKMLKSQNSTKHIPIIIISANKDTEQIAKNAGAEDFLSKPFEIEDLLSKVRKHISS